MASSSPIDLMCVKEEQSDTKETLDHSDATLTTRGSELVCVVPMNLSVKRVAVGPSLVSRPSVIPGLMSADDMCDISPESSMASSSSTCSESSLGPVTTRKRRKQTHVPDANKDEKYWARRIKNNEAAKRSRDMRIKREKIVFEENVRLERLVQELRTDLDRVATDNKECRLKIDLVLEENARLKSMIIAYQNQEAGIHQNDSENERHEEEV